MTTEDEMVGWHHQLNGHEFEQAPGVLDGQGSLACCSPWDRKELETTERLNNKRATVAAAESLQSCPTLRDSIDGNPPDYPVPGILQARTLEWVAISFSNACMHAKALQSCPTLCNPMDSSPPGFSVHGTLQARTLE